MTTSDHNLRASFEKYARLEVSLEELRVSSGLSWDLESTDGGYALTPMPNIEPPIEVNASHVWDVLTAHGEGNLESTAIQTWANLLIMSEAFVVSPNGSHAEREQVLNILHELATPEIYGALTRGRSAELRRALLGKPPSS